MSEFLNIGKIVNTHGVKGEVKVFPLTDDPSRYEFLKKVYIELDGNKSLYTITSVKYFKETVILKFKEVNDMSMAEGLKNSMIIIDKKDAVKLPEDSFFIDDIIGCQVTDTDRGTLGIVKEVLQTGSNDVYIVRGSDKYKEVLVPALKTVVNKIDIENKSIEVTLPEGLLDD